jgi:hypothetical protein
MAIDQEARRLRRVEMFRQVAAERIGKLNLAWIEVERGAGDAAAFLREAHTLKGEASLTGFALASKLVHAVEDYVKYVRDRGDAPVERDGDLILGGWIWFCGSPRATPMRRRAKPTRFLPRCLPCWENRQSRSRALLRQQRLRRRPRRCRLPGHWLRSRPTRMPRGRRQLRFLCARKSRFGSLQKRSTACAAWCPTCCSPAFAGVS